MTQKPEGGNPEVLGNTIADYLHACNQQLNTLPEGPERDDYGLRARDELDSLWEEEGLYGERCMVSGFAFYPKLITDEEVGNVATNSGMDEYQITAEEATLEGISLGFEYVQLMPEVPAALVYAFQLKYFVSHPHPTVTRTIELTAYYGERDCKILPLNMIDESYALEPTDELEEVRAALGEPELKEPVYEHNEICNVLSTRSNGLRNLLRSTKFRRMRHKQQIEIVDRIINAAEQETGVTNSQVLLDPQYAYLTKPQEGVPGGVRYEAIGLEGMVVSGLCVALTMLGRERLSGKRIWSDADLVTKEEGLVLSIEMDSLTFLPISGKVITPGEILHVPITGQEFQAIFSSERFED